MSTLHFLLTTFLKVNRNGEVNSKVKLNFIFYLILSITLTYNQHKS